MAGIYLNSKQCSSFLVRGNAPNLVPPLPFCLASCITLLFYMGHSDSDCMNGKNRMYNHCVLAIYYNYLVHCKQ